MRTGQRRREILRRVQANGHVQAAEMVTAFQVDASTIRRDLEFLAKSGQLERTHGGARLRVEAADVPYEVKRTAMLAAKKAIGQHAATLVRDGDVLVIDSGSTTFELAMALQDRSDITVITNDIRVASAIADKPSIRLLVAGGERMPSTYTLHGPATVDFLSELRADYTFIGADAASAATGVSNTNTAEVAVKRAMLNIGGSHVLLADSTKFNRNALVRVVGWDEIDLVITDYGLSDEDADALGREVIRVDPASNVATS